MPINLKTKDIRHLGPIRPEIIQALISQVEQISDSTWNTETAKNLYMFASLKECKIIVLRLLPRFGLPGDSNKYNLSMFAQYADVIEPILTEIEKKYGYYRGGYFPKIMLAKLPKRKQIYPHIDSADPRQVPHKVHVPLFTNPDCVFGVDKVSENLQVGQIYEINNKEVHWVKNHGNCDRIHLIVEYCPK